MKRTLPRALALYVLALATARLEGATSVSRQLESALDPADTSAQRTTAPKLIRDIVQLA